MEQEYNSISKNSFYLIKLHCVCNIIFFVELVLSNDLETGLFKNNLYGNISICGGGKQLHTF